MKGHGTSDVASAAITCTDPWFKAGSINSYLRVDVRLKEIGKGHTCRVDFSVSTFTVNLEFCVESLQILQSNLHKDPILSPAFMLVRSVNYLVLSQCFICRASHDGNK